MRKLSIVILAVGILWAGSSAGFAHAHLDHASPAVGSTVHGAPTELRLWFTEALEPKFSSLRVVDASGKEVAKADQAVDAANRKQLKLSLPPLAPGRYKVLWQVVSVDTHKTQGSFAFAVAP